MILMAIDHVRVYSGVPVWGSTLGIFFTRWITNFSAPAFVFLAGTSAYLYGRRFAERRELSQFLAIRGVWLVILELTFLRLSWTFNIDYRHYILAGVLWMIGWCMLLLALGIRLPLPAVATIGVLIITLHNVTDFFRSHLEHAFGSEGPNWLLKILYFGGAIKMGPSGPTLMVLYVLIPWAGLMYVGYGFGRVLELPLNRRRRMFLRLGIVLTAVFLLLRIFGVYGDPWPWSTKHTLFSFLGTTKYPASLEFLLMTIGPMFVLWYFAERWKGVIASIVETFGRVPMFFYLLHIPLIHAAACVVSLIKKGHIDPWLFANHPLSAGPAPNGYEWGLGLLYVVYSASMVVLYVACSCYAEVKRRSGNAWLSLL